MTRDDRIDRFWNLLWKTCKCPKEFGSEFCELSFSSFEGRLSQVSRLDAASLKGKRDLSDFRELGTQFRSEMWCSLPLKSESGKSAEVPNSPIFMFRCCEICQKVTGC